MIKHFLYYQDTLSLLPHWYHGQRLSESTSIPSLFETFNATLQAMNGTTVNATPTKLTGYI